MAKKQTKTKHIPKRNEVKPPDTWNLGKLFKSDAAWERAYLATPHGDPVKLA